MHSVNSDLLRAFATHNPDGRPKDPHAHHRAELLALGRAARRKLWLDRIARLHGLFAHRPARAKPFPDHSG
jgi:hypothetical protein